MTVIVSLSRALPLVIALAAIAVSVMWADDWPGSRACFRLGDALALFGSCTGK